MAFFDLPSDEELSPEVRQMLEEHRRLIGYETVAPNWRVFGRSPKIIEARLKAHLQAALALVTEHPTAARKEEVDAIRLKLAGLHFVVGER